MTTFENPQEPVMFVGGPAFDHETYTNIIEMARANFVQAIHSYWEKAAKADKAVKKFKPAAIALFEEENNGCDPYTLVCGPEPSRFTKGHLIFQHEIVPAWVLYLPRAAALLEILETRNVYDNPR